MQEKYKQFWLEKDKEEIIEAYGACIHNGEVLLARIDKAIEYINNHQPVFELSNIKQIQEWFEKEYYVELLEILKGEE